MTRTTKIVLLVCAAALVLLVFVAGAVAIAVGYVVMTQRKSVMALSTDNFDLGMRDASNLEIQPYYNKDLGCRMRIPLRIGCRASGLRMAVADLKRAAATTSDVQVEVRDRGATAFNDYVLANLHSSEQTQDSFAIQQQGQTAVNGFAGYAVVATYRQHGKPMECAEAYLNGPASTVYYLTAEAPEPEWARSGDMLISSLSTFEIGQWATEAAAPNPAPGFNIVPPTPAPPPRPPPPRPNPAPQTVDSAIAEIAGPEWRDRAAPPWRWRRCPPTRRSGRRWSPNCCRCWTMRTPACAEPRSWH